MKLSQIKNLGKELSKKDLTLIKGGATVHGMCNNGMTFTIRNAEITSDGGLVGGTPCDSAGIAFAIYQE